MLSSQSVVDAEGPGLGVGERAMNPWQDDMGGHDADHVGLMADIGGAGVGRPAVGLDRRAWRDIGGDEAVQRGGRCFISARSTTASRKPGAE